MDIADKNVICVGCEDLKKEALALSEHIGIPISDMPGNALTLMLDEGGLSLSGYGLSFKGDFEHMFRRVEKGRLSHEMIARIAKTKIKEPRAVDATAGMGEDSFLLAACGYKVTMYERDPVIAALLRDAMKRAENVPALKEIIGRMTLEEGDSIELMKKREERTDLVYLDPMFPERHKSGLINKRLQLIQKLEHPCDEEDELLLAAMQLCPEKIVIKRPLKGLYLSGKTPSYSIKGKAIRYDCLAFPRQIEQ